MPRRDQVDKRNEEIVALALAEPGLTQTQIAERYGLTHSSISLILKGKRGRSAKALAAIDPELAAIYTVIGALINLDQTTRERVISYALARLRGEPAI